jgi:hypothetical protein
LKPSKFFVGMHGATSVVDWGLAKPLDRVEPAPDGDERVIATASASG